MGREDQNDSPVFMFVPEDVIVEPKPVKTLEKCTVAPEDDPHWKPPPPKSQQRSFAVMPKAKPRARPISVLEDIPPPPQLPQTAEALVQPIDDSDA